MKKKVNMTFSNVFVYLYVSIDQPKKKAQIAIGLCTLAEALPKTLIPKNDIRFMKTFALDLSLSRIKKKYLEG